MFLYEFYCWRRRSFRTHNCVQDVTRCGQRYRQRLGIVICISKVFTFNSHTIHITSTYNTYFIKLHTAPCNNFFFIITLQKLLFFPGYKDYELIHKLPYRTSSKCVSACGNDKHTHIHTTHIY